MNIKALVLSLECSKTHMSGSVLALHRYCFHHASPTSNERYIPNKTTAQQALFEHPTTAAIFIVSRVDLAINSVARNDPSRR